MNTKNEQLFFARFLEGQDFPKVKTNLKAGPARSQKFPSVCIQNDSIGTLPTTPALARSMSFADSARLSSPTLAPSHTVEANKDAQHIYIESSSNKSMRES